MKLFEVIKAIDGTFISCEKAGTVSNIYAGDILSLALSHLTAGSLWISGLDTVNMIAIASVKKIACIVLVENIAFSDDIVKVAKEHDVCVISTPLSTYRVCSNLSKVFKG